MYGNSVCVGSSAEPSIGLARPRRSPEQPDQGGRRRPVGLPYKVLIGKREDGQSDV